MRADALHTVKKASCTSCDAPPVRCMLTPRHAHLLQFDAPVAPEDVGVISGPPGPAFSKIGGLCRSHA